MTFDGASRSCLWNGLNARRWAAVCIVALTGCRHEVSPPATFPVTGRVVATGGQVPPGASVQFLPSDAEYSALGFVDTDGNFSLSVLFGARKLSGAIAGPHQVIVIYPLDAKREGGQKFTLRRELVVKPTENQFTITLDKDSAIHEQQ